MEKEFNKLNSDSEAENIPDELDEVDEESKKEIREILSESALYKGCSEEEINTAIKSVFKIKMKSFRDEIQALKDKEMDKKKKWEERGMKGRAYDPHFDLLNPQHLGAREYSAYKFYKKAEAEPKLFNVEDFEELRSSAMAFYEDFYKNNPNNPEFESRRLFWGHIGSKIKNFVFIKK
jgi:hypothetical protein